MPFLILVPLAILCFIGAAFTSMPIVLVALGSAYLGAGITWLIMAYAALPETPMEVQPSQPWPRPEVLDKLKDLPGEVMKTGHAGPEIKIKRFPPRRDGEAFDPFEKWRPTTEEGKKKRHRWIMNL